MAIPKNYPNRGEEVVRRKIELTKKMEEVSLKLPSDNAREAMKLFSRQIWVDPRSSTSDYWPTSDPHSFQLTHMGVQFYKMVYPDAIEEIVQTTTSLKPHAISLVSTRYFTQPFSVKNHTPLGRPKPTKLTFTFFNSVDATMLRLCDTLDTYLITQYPELREALNI